MESFMHQYNYKARLMARGFRKIGGGLYSDVLAKDGSDRCIKVAHGDRWPDYIDWADRNGYLGTFAPKVYSFKQHLLFYVAVMERLVCDFRDIEHYNGHKITSDVQVFFKEARAAMGFINYDYQTENIDTAAPFISFCTTLRANKLADDCHEGNFMVRKDGQVVLIDPLSAYSKQPSKLRIKNGLTVAINQRTVTAQIEPQHVQPAIENAIPF